LTRAPRRCSSRTDTSFGGGQNCFSFGRIKMDTGDRVTETGGTLMPGLFAAGRLAGQLFSLDNPGGARPLNGATFDRIAAITAGQRAEQSR
jgi:tricarballylate dehydrogenase